MNNRCDLTVYFKFGNEQWTAAAYLEKILSHVSNATDLTEKFEWHNCATKALESMEHHLGGADPPT